MTEHEFVRAVRALTAESSIRDLVSISADLRETTGVGPRESAWYANGVWRVIWALERLLADYDVQHARRVFAAGARALAPVRGRLPLLGR